MYRFDVKILNQSRDFLLATVLISGATWDLISEIPCPLLDSAAPWEVRSCSWPYVRYPSVWETDGKTRENSRNFPHGEAANTSPSFRAGIPPPRRKYLIKSSSAKISRWIFSEREERHDSSCQKSPLQRLSLLPWMRCYSSWFFNLKLLSQQKFYGRIFSTDRPTFQSGHIFGVSSLQPPERITLWTFQNSSAVKEPKFETAGTLH